MVKFGAPAFAVIMVLILIAGGNYGDAVAYVAIPWWVKAIQFVVQIPVLGTIGVLAIVYFVFIRR